jgi:hypothetical protein
MVPAGYLAKRVAKRPGWLQAPQIEDIYSLSGCESKDFAGYIDHWKHNGYWLLDSPGIIRNLAHEESVKLEGTTLFYYEVHEFEFEGQIWKPLAPDPGMATNVSLPAHKLLEGFDVVTFSQKNLPEHSPLSCNSLAEELHTNAHCLFATFEEAEANINKGAFANCEPGPYRIFSVFTADWF